MGNPDSQMTKKLRKSCMFFYILTNKFYFTWNYLSRRWKDFKTPCFEVFGGGGGHRSDYFKKSSGPNS